MRGMDLKTFFSEGHISQAELARRLDVTPGLVWQWVTGHRQVAAEQAIPIEKATDGKVSRHELRPDIYPREPSRRSELRA